MLSLGQRGSLGRGSRRGRLGACRPARHLGSQPSQLPRLLHRLGLRIAVSHLQALKLCRQLCGALLGCSLCLLQNLGLLRGL